MIDTPTWDQFMAGSGFIDVLARLHAPVVTRLDPSMDVEDMGSLIATEENLRAMQEKVSLTSPLTPVLVELFEWWEEYRTGVSPTGTYRLRARLKQVNLKRVRALNESPVDVVEDDPDDIPSSVGLPKNRVTTLEDVEVYDMARVLTVEDLDGSRVPPPPTLEEVSRVCWGELTALMNLERYNLLMREKKERMATMGEGAGEDAGIDGWKKYVTKTIQP